ncbi:Plasma membrane t-SNARE, secretory vesicle fusion [Podochytrium sp. JEL0797]|nr:Plasma membrane t-SNARE, secretory vesicle fusion [Podochytrium sp. JEL0797]
MAPLKAISRPDPLLLSPAQDMDTFYRQRDLLIQYIARIESNLSLIRQANVRLLQEVNQNNTQKLKSDLDSLTTETSLIVQFCRDGVKMLHRSRKGDKNIRKGQYNFVLQKLQTATRNFLDVQNNIKMSKRDQIARQYRIARPNATEDEIQEAIDSGRTDVFNEVMLSSRIQDKQRVLGAVQDRQKELEKVLSSMTQLQEMMVEMNELIAKQQDMIDDTETHIENTVVDVGLGSDQLTQANKSAAKARKTKWIIFWVVLVILLVIAAIIAWQVEANKPK